jgi:hypothetical protein
MQEADKHTSPSRHIPRKKKRFSIYPLVMSHFTDAEPSHLREATREKVWKDTIIEEC